MMIAIDIQSVLRAAHVLPLVQDQVPSADDDYVYAGAVGVGLNRLFDPTFKFGAADFVAAIEADDELDVDVSAADEARGTSLADDLGVDPGRLFSAALCTGLAKLAGDTSRLVGPFEVF